MATARVARQSVAASGAMRPDPACQNAVVPSPALLVLACACTMQPDVAQFMSSLKPLPQGDSRDWLIGEAGYATGAFRTGPNRVTLSNGVMERTLLLGSSPTTISLRLSATGAEMIRAVTPEATFVLDGVSYVAGGLEGQPDRAYLRETWLKQMTAPENGLEFISASLVPIEARLEWKRSKLAHDIPWPPKGRGLSLVFRSRAATRHRFEVIVRYEMYDGMPLYSKWVEIKNTGSEPLTLNRLVVEEICFVEAESAVGQQPKWRDPDLHLFTDYSFGGDTMANANRAVSLATDPQYDTQVNYELKMPAILRAEPPVGPNVPIAPNEKFRSFRVFGLLHDSTERERRGLAVRRALRVLAPWIAESPLMLHLTSLDEKQAMGAIQQCAEVGFEMVILSFGSGLNMEDASAANIAKIKRLVDFAHERGVSLGGYSLLASRSISPEDDVINPNTGKPGGAIFGNSPCLLSRWGDQYFANLRKFIEETGFDLLEHDGSYPGDVCSSTTHPGHAGLEDSQWKQFQRIAELYRWCRQRGVHLNVPDWYVLAGSNKIAMGYRETNWSLPREQQHIHARQNLFDGTWEKPPTMGWMFVPLVQYHGGGAAATIEPLREHLADYEQHLISNLAFGAQACYRGPRLYDSEETKRLVQKWVAWFKKHRAILESDIVHGRRADGRDVDWIVHVNPSLDERALAAFWNPSDYAVEYDVRVPLYYTGLKDRARVSMNDGPPKSITLTEDRRAEVTVSIPARGFSYLVFSR